jgi:hypothetical protein
MIEIARKTLSFGVVIRKRGFLVENTTLYATMKGMSRWIPNYENNINTAPTMSVGTRA